jgi:hypothetical protein
MNALSRWERVGVREKRGAFAFPTASGLARLSTTVPFNHSDAKDAKRT